MGDKLGGLAAFFVLLFFALRADAQQPCVHIESIFVDACTLGGSCPNAATPTCSCEGKNEMMRIRIGDQDQLLSNLIVNWPNNTFQGFCQDALTAQNTADLNATIEACGWLEEPLDGILPANSSILIVTSADMCVEANSFAGLADTLYVLYQCPGNFQGHFANFGTGLRTTTVSFGGACSSSATYDRSLLTMQDGSLGGEDGATVDFPVDGSAPIYYNVGCTAPVLPVIVEADSPNTSACPNIPIALEANVQGVFSELEWTTNGSGVIADAAAQTTTYTPSEEDAGTLTFTFLATDCNGTFEVSFEVDVVPPIDPTITVEGEPVICFGESLVLSVNDPGGVLWSTGDTTSSITVTEPGTYEVFLTSNCDKLVSDITIEEAPLPSLDLSSSETVLCDNETATLTAITSGEVSWPDGSSGETYTVTGPGTYTVTVSNACGEITESITIEDGPVPSLSLSSSVAELCANDDATLTAESNGTLSWPDGSSNATFTVTGSGTYTVTASNSCGTSSESITLDALPEPSVSLITADPVVICLDDFAVLEAEGLGELSWSDGANGPSTIVSEFGTYTVTATNECGSVSASIDVVPSGVNAFFTASPPDGAAPLLINLDNQSTGAQTFEWLIDGNSFSTEESPSLEIDEPGSHTITLIVEDAFGCTDTYSITVEVDSCDRPVFLPNIFSPNNDGNNDRFDIATECMREMELLIYNRWGTLVYEGSKTSGAWDGRDGGGNPLNEGVYYAILTYTDFSDETIILKGAVTLVRTLTAR